MLESELTALVSVIVIDLVLAGDNAIVVGMAAAGLPNEMRRKAILFGIAAAAFLRIVFAFGATYLLAIVPLVLIGGLLLLWVAWKLWRETRQAAQHRQALGADALDGTMDGRLYDQPLPVLAGGPATGAAVKTFGGALTQIVIADVSMSLDNVLAVAGTARDHRMVMVLGLCLSVVLMGAAATIVARLLGRYPWISYLGLTLIAWVAVKMIWEGGHGTLDMAKHSGLI